MELDAGSHAGRSTQMVERQTCTWTGASGRKYVYDVYRRHPKVQPRQSGNFIYAKMDERRRWVPIYIGQSDLTQRVAVKRDRAQCVEAKGATHVHLHVNFKKAHRLAEEKDLLKNFPQAYVPDGCNKMEGG
jgi:hypothetical protein